MPEKIRQRIVGHLVRSGIRVNYYDKMLPLTKWNELEARWRLADVAVLEAHANWQAQCRILVDERRSQGAFTEYEKPHIEPATTREGLEQQRQQQQRQPWHLTLNSGEYKTVRHYTDRATGKRMAQVIRIAPGENSQIDALRAVFDDLTRRRNELAVEYFK